MTVKELIINLLDEDPNADIVIQQTDRESCTYVQDINYIERVYRDSYKFSENDEKGINAIMLS